MPRKIIVTKVDKVRWQKAQKFETDFAHRTNSSGNDWNDWWKNKTNKNICDSRYLGSEYFKL